MKLTARSNRAIHSEGSAIHPSPLFSKNKNDGAANLYIRDDNEGHDSTESERNRSTNLRRCIIRWRLSKLSFKIGFAVASSFLLFLVSIRIWDQLFYQIGGFGENHSSSSSSSSTNFAVVINTFRRPDRLQQTVRHYAETCGRRYKVGQIFVVWADPETDPPPSGESFFDSSASSFSLRANTNGTTTSTSERVPVEILIKKKDSLNARFEPIEQLRTTSVFMVDDDIRVDCSSLQVGFQAWQKHPDSMVGYYPRLAASPAVWTRSDSSTTDPEQFVYHAWPMLYWRQKFNIVLTKASFLHSKYLELYTNDDSFPKEIKDHVDQHRNCEDIAMSMLVANYTKYNNSKKRSSRPFYVEGRVSDVGLFGGISSGTGHFATRSDCLTQLTAIFRSKGWGIPLEDQFDLVGSSWVQHAPGFWWQSRPSNIFEWLGLANFFS